MSFLKVVYPLKYPSTACLRYSDNGFIGYLTNKALMNIVKKFLNNSF